MKPSERIIEIARELCKKETKDNNPYANWETLEDLEKLYFNAKATDYFLQAIIQYLDEKSL